MKIKITIGECVIEIDGDAEVNINGGSNLGIKVEREEDVKNEEGKAADASTAPIAAVLSKREASILEKVALGQSNKEIARILVLTESTVKVHMKAILRKLRMKNRTQAALWANGGANGNGNHLGLAADNAGTKHATNHRRELQNGG